MLNFVDMFYFSLVWEKCVDQHKFECKFVLCCIYVEISLRTKKIVNKEPI